MKDKIVKKKEFIMICITSYCLLNFILVCLRSGPEFRQSYAMADVVYFEEARNSSYHILMIFADK